MKFLLILTLWFPLMANNFECELEEGEGKEDRYASCAVPTPVAAASDEKNNNTKQEPNE